jgi:hypothetical protein
METFEIDSGLSLAFSIVANAPTVMPMIAISVAYWKENGSIFQYRKISICPMYEVKRKWRDIGQKVGS